jgi:hypothetical protein
MAGYPAGTTLALSATAQRPRSVAEWEDKCVYDVHPIPGGAPGLHLHWCD